MAALLAAHPEAAKEKDEVRPLCPCTLHAAHACVYPHTRPPPCCAGWRSAAALCRGRERVGGGGGGAAGGASGGGQGEEQGGPATPAHPFSQAAPRRVSACTLLLACRRAAQKGRLPLHHALGKQASEAVVAALLAAYPEAAKERNEVSGRAARPTAPLPLPVRTPVRPPPCIS